MSLYPEETEEDNHNLVAILFRFCVSALSHVQITSDEDTHPQRSSHLLASHGFVTVLGDGPTYSSWFINWTTSAIGKFERT